MRGVWVGSGSARDEIVVGAAPAQERIPVLGVGTSNQVGGSFDCFNAHPSALGARLVVYDGKPLEVSAV